jgi:class 3 adenylate cyclase/tetratricopeptide (TPR) repeat protein
VDDAYLEDLKVELIEVQELASDRDGKMLVWSGEAARTPESPLAPATHEPATPPPTAYAAPPLAHTPPYLAEKILTARHALEGERKQVTVLFADIKDSTELIRDLDPEEAQHLLDPAIHIMMEAVHRFEGTVNQVLGDGIMALFGAPIAHEDHAARACYAALAMQAAMQPYDEEVRRSHGLTMRIRVGLNSGEVVVRTIGNDLHMDYSAVGHSTHLAARMEQLANPGSIMLTAATLRLVEGLVRVNAWGPIPVKGLSEPVKVFELQGASTIRRRLQAAVARGLTKFVGRETEIEALNHAREQAEARHGQVVAAVGEAGVGKSRLVYEFVHSHRTQGWLVLESASVSYGKATPYSPVIDLLKRYVHVEEGDDPRTIRAKTTGQIFTLDESLQGTIPALLSLLDALPEDSAFLQLDPPQRRQRTLDGVKRILLRESQAQPLLLVFEDLHWIDSETQALLDGLIEEIPNAQLLLLVNYRPEYQHGWGSNTFYTQLRLDPLPPESGDAFLAALLGNDPSLEPLKKLLIERTAGNPFFLEESVRTLAETQVLIGQSGAYHLGQALPTIQVPATVQAVLAARIDRLSQEEKRLLQTASVIGTEVPFTLLQAIAEQSEEALYRALTPLQTAEFLYETSLFPERIYTFKHALTHEVAYKSLLQGRRQTLHARIVDALEALGGDRSAEQVERLAHHAYRGEVWDKALTYYRQAGDKAMARSAFREAVACFEQALVAVPHLPAQRDTLAQAIDLHMVLDTAFLGAGASRRGLEHLREAERLAESLGDQGRLGRICVALIHPFWRTGDYDQAIAYGQRALDLTAANGDVFQRARAYGLLGTVYFSLGDYRRAVDVLKQSIMALEGELLHAHAGMLVTSVRSRDWLVACLGEMGEFAEGRACGEAAARIAQAAGHLGSTIYAQYQLGHLALRQGNLPYAIPVLERALAHCRTADIPLWLPAITQALGLAYALSGRVVEALPLLELAVEQQSASAQRDGTHEMLLGLSEAYILSDRPGAAVQLAERALTLSRDRKERGSQAWALRLLGDIAAHRNPPDCEQAETHYQQALVLANELGMCPLQAHCHRGLGTLYRQTGQSAQARAALSTAINMYREMEMTFWLPQAEATLSQVDI